MQQRNLSQETCVAYYEHAQGILASKLENYAPPLSSCGNNEHDNTVIKHNKQVQTSESCVRSPSRASVNINTKIHDNCNSCFIWLQKLSLISREGQIGVGGEGKQSTEENV